ncbi:hypothetical protein SDJN02_24943, partial [Cucurbita argyrosperma subsp. argyrosperma]
MRLSNICRFTKRIKPHAILTEEKFPVITKPRECQKTGKSIGPAPANRPQPYRLDEIYALRKLLEGCRNGLDKTSKEIIELKARRGSVVHHFLSLSSMSFLLNFIFDF